jgi:hypothetical protein
VISKILAPIFGIDEDSGALTVAAEIAMHFHAHVEVASAAPRSGRRFKEPSGTTDGLGSVFERWRHEHRLRIQPECLHRGLASTAWMPLVGVPEEELPRRAQVSDLVCLGRKRGGRGAPVSRLLQAMLFNTGRPVVIVPVAEDATAPILGEPVIIGWNGSVEAVHAVTAALPFMRISRNVEIVSVSEEAVNAMDAYELARYLAWQGIRVSAAGIARKDWTGGDFVAIAAGRGAGLLVMGAHRRDAAGTLGNATRHVLEHMPMPVILTA